MSAANPAPPQQGQSVGNIIGDVVVLTIVFYFAFQRQPLLDYYNGPIMLDAFWTNADDTTAWFVAFLVDASDTALMSLAVLAYLSLFLSPRGYASGVGTLLLLILLGFGGWWLGTQFAEAAARNAACQRDSFFGLGCDMDTPALAFLGFSFLCCLLALKSGLVVIAGILERLQPNKHTA